MFLALSSTCIQKFSNWHGPMFLNHSLIPVAVVALIGVSHVACKAPDDSFYFFFYHLVSRSHFDSHTI